MNKKKEKPVEQAERPTLPVLHRAILRTGQTSDRYEREPDRRRSLARGRAAKI